MSDVRFVPLFLVQNGKICICLFQCWANDNIEQIERTIASFVMLDALNIIWDWVYPVVWNVDLCVCGTHSIATLPATTKHDVAQLFWESQRVSYGVHTPHEHIDRSLWNYMQLKGQRQRTTFYMDSWLQIIVYVCVCWGRPRAASVVYIAFMSPSSIHLILWKRTLVFCCYFSSSSLFACFFLLVPFICTIIVHTLFARAYLLLSSFLWSFPMFYFFSFLLCCIFSYFLQTHSHCDNATFLSTF